MNIPEDVKKKLGNAIAEIVRYTMKECYLCGKKIRAGRILWNFRKPEEEKAIYMRGAIICPQCNEQKIEEVNKLKGGETFNFGVFNN